jgi:hypothetical protein
MVLEIPGMDDRYGFERQSWLADMGKRLAGVNMGAWSDAKVRVRWLANVVIRGWWLADMGDATCG